MGDEAALRFVEVSKSYGRAPALVNFSLEVRRGEFFGLVGVNGAGKTTLIKCLLDFCLADSGAIEIFGTPHRVTASRARLAFLPERFVPPYYLTGRDFLEYMLTLHSAAYEPREVERMFAALDLGREALTRPVRAFSKGMTQKLGLGACLLSGKDLYVLDEPTGGLDPKARALLKSSLGELRGAGRTVFFTSHALADVAEICDRMAVLHAGKMLFAGEPRQLCERFGAPDLEQAFLRCIGTLA